MKKTIKNLILILFVSVSFAMQVYATDKIEVQISRIENSIWGFEYSKDDSLKRLSRIENNVFGATYEKLTTQERIKKLNESNKTFEEGKIAVESIDIKGIENSPSIYYIISSAEAASNLARFDGLRYGYCTNDYKNFDDMVILNRTKAFGREVKRRIMLGNFVLRCDLYENYYKKATLLRSALSREINDIFKKYDFILTPLTCRTSYAENTFKNDVTGMYASDCYTVFANLCGIPAISVPTYLTEDGKSVSVQLLSAKFNDRELIRIADFLEKNLSIVPKPKIGGNCLGI